MDCERVRSISEPFLRGATTPRQDRRLERHLAECPACREWFGAADPIRIFDNLRPQARDDRFWSDFWPRVREGIETPAAAPGWWSLGWRPLAAVAAGVASVAIGVGLWSLFRTTKPEPIPLAIRPTAVQERTAGVRPAAGPPPTVETYPSAKTRVFNFRLEEPSGPPTEVILIFDESIDL